MNQRAICYKCGKLATTREHVPPLCLFPEKKDVFSLDYRINLITVPSCLEHNSQKSNDDEFLLSAIAGVVGNNYLGYFHTKTKVSRIYNRKGKDYVNQISKNHEELTITATDGKKYPVIKGSADQDRLKKCFEHIACGLYYHEFKKVFKGECVFIIDFLKTPFENFEKVKLWCEKSFHANADKWPEKGSNPAVFKYQIGEPDSQGLIPIKMVFYGGTVIYGSFKDEKCGEIFDLGYFLIEKGIRTTVDFGDGDPIIFNNDEQTTI